MSILPPVRPDPPQAVLCPFCGTAQFTQDLCSACHQPMNDKGRKQAQIEMGPWFIRNKVNPFGPGYSYEKVKRLAADGILTAKSVVRGPSTQQFWLMAKFTPGISHLVGHCFACPAPAKATDPCCSVCKVPFREYPDRNSLGLRYRTEEEAQAARKELMSGTAIHKMLNPPKLPSKAAESQDIKMVVEDRPKQAFPPQQAVMDADKSGEIPFIPGADLIDQIFGKK